MSDHSSINHFIDRIGPDGFAAICDGLNDELLRPDMLSPEICVDSRLVKANVNGYGYGLELRRIAAAKFEDQAIKEKALFVLGKPRLRTTVLSVKRSGYSRVRKADCRRSLWKPLLVFDRRNAARGWTGAPGECRR